MDKRLWTSFTESSSRLWSLRLEGLRPCTCNRCAMHDDDPWFTKRFNASLNPFLTQDNALSEHDFRWWKTLPFGNKPFLSYRMAELKVFEIFPEQESFMDSSPDRCRTCAVVGNSVNLLGSHYGPLIDFHDVIMRFNTARTVGYEGDVGNKTTIHIMYPESSVDLDDHTHLMLFPFKIRDLEWLVSAFTTKSVKSTYKQVKSTVKANQGLVKVLHPGFIQYVHENWLGKKESIHQLASWVWCLQCTFVMRSMYLDLEQTRMETGTTTGRRLEDILELDSMVEGKSTNLFCNLQKGKN
ncbi:unnamed protein product [Boreogadus saida]